MRKHRSLWGYFFIAPQLIGLIGFSLIPLVFAFVLGFMNWDLNFRSKKSLIKP